MKSYRYWLVVFCFGFTTITNCDNPSIVETWDAVTSIKDVPVTVAANLISSTFAKREKNGLPAGWEITREGEHPDSAVVNVILDKKTGQNVVKIDIRKEASVFVDTVQGAQLDPKKEYLLIVQFKIQNMHFIGDWYKRPAGVKLYVYGTNNQHAWLAVYGKGSTDGWVTAVMPFPDRWVGAADTADLVANPQVYLRCYNMVGTVWFRNPMIVRKPAGMAVSRFWEMENGTRVYGGLLMLVK